MAILAKQLTVTVCPLTEKSAVRKTEQRYKCSLMKKRDGWIANENGDKWR